MGSSYNIKGYLCLSGIQFIEIYNINSLKSPGKMEKYSKLQWSNEEELYLKVLKQEQDIKSWKLIATMVNARFPDRNRNGKQCRERYMNYIRFDNEKPKILGWDQKDDLVLFDNFLQFGAKWVQISQRMQGRSQNCLKNRFYGALRRVIRKINKIQKDKKLKYKKSIKYDSLMRILSHKVQDQAEGQTGLISQRSQFVAELRKDIISIAVSQQENIPTDQILSLIARIHQFNCFGRVLPAKISKVNSFTDDSIPLTDPRVQEMEPQNGKELPTQVLDEIRPMNMQKLASQSVFQNFEDSYIMQIINDTNLSRNRNRDLDQELCEILSEKYSPECLPFF